MKGLIRVRRKLALVLAILLSAVNISFAAGFGPDDFVDSGVLFEYDFESEVPGDMPSAEGNIYAINNPEWTNVPVDYGYVEAEKNGNQYFKFENKAGASAAVSFKKYFSMSLQEIDAFKLEFELRNMGAETFVYFYDMVGAQNTPFVKTKRGEGAVYNKTITNTQWNDYVVYADAVRNYYQVWVNGSLAYEGIMQSKYNPGKTTCSIVLQLTLATGDVAYLDNVKVTRLKHKSPDEIEQVKTPDEDITYDFTPSKNGIPAFAKAEKTLGEAAFTMKGCRVESGLTVEGYRTYMTFIGTPAYVYEFDTLTGKFINKLPSGNGQNQALEVGSDGMLYNNPGGTAMYSYDPGKAKTAMDLINKYQTNTMAIGWHMNPGDNGNADKLYTAHYNYNCESIGGQPVLEYDIKTKECKMYYGVFEGKYMHAATGNDKYIFASAGDEAGGERLIRIDKETGERLEWHNTDADITAGNMGQCVLIGNRLFTRIRQWSFVIDTDTMTEFARFQSGTRGGKQAVTWLKPDGDNKTVYYISPDEKSLMEFNLETGETKENVKFKNPVAGLGIQDYGSWVKKADGSWAIVAHKGYDTVGIITPGNPEIEIISFKIPEGDMGSVTQPDNYYVSRDDIIYVGGYEAGLSAFDLKTNTSLFAVNNEIQHGMTMVNGKLLCGTYASGNFYLYDPKKPALMSQGNPKYVWTAPGVCRHYNMEDTTAGFGLISGITDYGGTEGSVILGTYADGEPKFLSYNNVIPRQNIVGIEYKDGYVYVSSTVVVNLHEPEKEACIAKVDARTGETVLTKSYQLEGAGTLERIGEIRFGPDGLLYAIANPHSTVMAIDPETLDVVRYKTYYPLRSEGSGVASPKVFFGAEGVLYTCMGGQLHAINPETFEVKLAWNVADRFCMDNDGNLIKRAGGNSSGTSLAAIEVDQRQRLDLMIKNAKKYYKEEEFSVYTWKVFKKALSEAEALDLTRAPAKTVKEAARKLTFAIEDLQTKYDEEAGWAYMFGRVSAFNDMANADDKTNHAVNMLKQYGIISGTDDESFSPERAITRAEFVKMLSNAELFDGIAPEAAHEFTDVSKTDWSYPYIQNAYEKGWIKGASDTEFKPSDVITEEEIILILNRIKENAFEAGEAKPCNRADAAVLIYEFINKV